MNTIYENNEKTTIIKKSKFIGIALEVSSKEVAESIISSYKERYKDATHVCYAYIIGPHEKASDDGEPKGTAGLPMLDLLKKKELTNILGIVVRYFGGVKLGASGLLHAYVDSLNETLINNIAELIDGYSIKIEFPYSLEKDINYILRNISLIDKTYEENIIYSFDCNKDIVGELKSLPIKFISIEQKMIKK